MVSERFIRLCLEMFKIFITKFISRCVVKLFYSTVTSLHDRYLRIESRVGHAISLAELDKGINIEVHRMTFPVKGIIKSDTYLQSICSISQLSLTEYQTLIMQNCFVYVLIETAFQFINISPNCNRKLYRLDKLICSFLKTAGGQGDVSKSLYLAMYYYRTYRFREALGVTAAVKSKLIQPYLLYFDRVDPEKYNESVSGWPLSRRIKKACASSIDMLSVLCNYRLGNRSQCLQSLTDLQTLLLSDDGRYVPLPYRDLSWQILGICQHVVGDLHGAMQSYQESLRQKPFHRLQRATEYRIMLALNRLKERY
nr:uncharacterized protein LOC117689818 [Crassostrea gigas]